MEAAFSVRSAPGLYNEDLLPLRDSLEAAVRRVGRWPEIAERFGELRVSVVRRKKLVAEAGDSPGTQTKGNVRRWSRYQVTTSED
jgi:hypothetical protein